MYDGGNVAVPERAASLGSEGVLFEHVLLCLLRAGPGEGHGDLHRHLHRGGVLLNHPNGLSLPAALSDCRHAPQQDLPALRPVRPLQARRQHQPKRTYAATQLFKYNDAVVEFIRLLLIRFDFDSAGRQLAELRREVESDPFLVKLAPKIIESSRGLYYETYCRIHETLQIANVAAFTGKDPEEAELWIVSLIRRSGISVRVDSVAGTIKIVRNLGRNSNEVKYAELIPRTNTLVNNLSRILLQG